MSYHSKLIIWMSSKRHFLSEALEHNAVDQTKFCRRFVVLAHRLRLSQRHYSSPQCNPVKRLRVVLTLSSLLVCLCTYYNSHVPPSSRQAGFNGGPRWWSLVPRLPQAAQIGFSLHSRPLLLQAFLAFHLQGGGVASSAVFSIFLRTLMTL